MNKIETIYYVVDQKGWVQHRRLEYLRKYQNRYKIKLLTATVFKILWLLGFLRKKFIFFSTWRIVHGILKKNPNFFKKDDFKYMMVAVTSHSNIGGGLDPRNPIPDRSPEEAYRLAIELLKKFKVVTANSKILVELLNSGLPEVQYCPNGVDISFFNPDGKKQYNPDRITIGWVGKVRGPKNYEVVHKAGEELEKNGFEINFIKVSKKFRKAPFSQEEMRRFYQGIDYYLCASWNEGTPNPALEAGACGVPVISTCVGNMRELIIPEENGFFVDPTVASIVSCFKKLSKLDRCGYLEMSNSMRLRIETEWAWQKQIQYFEHAFDRLVH